MVLYLCRMCRWGLHAALWSYIGTLMRLLAAEPCSTAGFLFPCRYLYGTILVTHYSMVWDWRVSRTVPMNFYWLCCWLLFCFQLFYLFLLSSYGLILQAGWGLRANSVYIALNLALPFFLIIIIIIIMIHREYYSNKYYIFIRYKISRCFLNLH